MSSRKGKSSDGRSSSSQRQLASASAASITSETVQPAVPYDAVARVDDTDASVGDMSTYTDQQQRPRRVVQATTDTQKIKYNKTKKLRKKASALYMKSMADISGGKFAVSVFSVILSCFDYVMPGLLSLGRGKS